EVTPPDHVRWYAAQKSMSRESFVKFFQESARPVSFSVWVSSLVNLPDHKKAFFMVVNLGSNVQPRYLVALIDSLSLLKQSVHLPGMILDLYLNHQPINSVQDVANPPWVFEVSQNLYGALWEIKAKEAMINLGIFHFISNEMPLSWITLLLGLFISILLARSVALSDLLKERTIILDKINQDLKREITEHIQTEETKKNLERALLQSQKLQAIGTLAGGIAHDFNNILYAISGYVGLARDEVPKDSIVYKNLGKVLEGTHRGQDLVARILSFSRRQHHEQTSLTLKSEISGALSLLRPAIPESVDIQFKSTCESKILGNKTQIHQIIVNLINNAVDAMDSEGTITITLDQISSEELAQYKFSSIIAGNYCRISVSDTGHGMDKSTLERIFDPFFTTKEVGKGTGLGLSTVHAITKEFNGEIIVNSQPGQGTTFTLFFPVYSEEGGHNG
ncbi:MAG TPA: ATP-binding protein, partial [Gammaproteobacteria bacterium]|nr:ATP-binding protein [Gammaproteobacteria bacterium]